MNWGTTNKDILIPRPTLLFATEWAQQQKIPLHHAVMICQVLPYSELKHVTKCLEILLGIEIVTIRDILQDLNGQTYMLIYAHTDLRGRQRATSLHLLGAAPEGCPLVYALLDKEEGHTPQQPLSINLRDFDVSSNSQPRTPMLEKTTWRLPVTPFEVGAIPKQSVRFSKEQGEINPKNTGLVVVSSPISPQPDSPFLSTTNSGESNMAEILQKLSEAIVTATHTHSYRKLKVFSGNQPVPVGEETFEAWKDNALQLLEEWSCTDIIKKQRLMESLRSPATEIIRLYKGVNAQTTAQDYIQALQDAYEKSEDSDDLLVKFLATKQKEHENSSDYINRLQLLLGKLFQKGAVTASELNTRLSKQIQRGGLSNDPIMIMLRVKLDDQVLSYSTLINKAKKLEDQMSSSPLRKGNTFKAAEKEDMDLEILKKKIAELELLSKPEAKRTDSSPRRQLHRGTMRRLLPEDSSPQGSCFKCGKLGHFKQECPTNSSETDVEVLAIGLENASASSVSKKSKKNHISVGAKIGPKSIIHLQIEGIYASALLDTGSQVTIIYRDFYDHHLSHIPLEPAGELQLWGVGSQAQSVQGCIRVTVTIPQLKHRNDLSYGIGSSYMPSGKKTMCSNYSGYQCKNCAGHVQDLRCISSTTNGGQPCFRKGVSSTSPTS
uniref:CCHC-type domain-containing protein n=1 Tax=Leptobrachium leishanense TaxID=445787 RepID=A0A8C5PGB1_9ANUR